VGMAQCHQLQLWFGNQPFSGPSFQEPRSGELFFQGLTRPVPRSGNPSGNPGADIWMEASKKKTGGCAPEHKTKEPISQITAPNTVPMGQEGPPSLDIQDHGLLQKLHAHLLPEVAPSPPIVVAAKEKDRNPLVHQPGQSSEDPGMTSGNHAPIFEPEIEQVTVDDDPGGITSTVFQPGQEGSLRPRGSVPQVDIAGQVDGKLGHGERR